MTTSRQIQKYLEKTGWIHKHTTRAGSFVYGRMECNDSFLVPTDRSLGDYDELLNEVVQKISEYEAEDILRVREKIAFLSKDILRFRSDSPLAKDGTLPLQAWEKHFDFTVRSIKVAATCIIKQVSNVKRLNSKDASNFASKCRIGQTEIGSYVTKAIIPLGDHQNSVHLEDRAAKDPSGRQLSSFIVNSALIIERASVDLRLTEETKEFERLKENKSLALICERMCSAFEDVSNAFSNKLNLSIKLTPSMDLPYVPVDIKKTATISSDYISEIKEVRNVISSKFTPKRESITGFVTSLSQATYKDNVQEGFVTIFDGTKKIHANFDAEMYSVAIEAHRSKRPIALTGTLYKEKRKLHLIEPSDLLVL